MFGVFLYLPKKRGDKLRFDVLLKKKDVDDYSA
jgi:hypothetical protein